MSVKILVGDVRDMLKTLPDNSVDCCISSPPYYGLRDYGVDGQIGLEPTLGEHMQVLVEVFREVKRVLKPAWTCWINYGDAYASAPNGRSAADTKAVGNDDRTFRDKPISTVGPVYIVDPRDTERVGNSSTLHTGQTVHVPGRVVAGGTMKPKDRMLLPARLAIALHDDGWWLRDEIIWHKPNPMPSSVSDRTTPAHEMLYMFSKCARYFYDADAIAEPVAGDPDAPRNQWDTKDYLIPGQKPQKRTNRGNWKTPDGWDTSAGEGGHGSVHRQGREKGHTGWLPSEQRVKTSGNLERKPPTARGAPDDGRTNQAGSVPWDGTTRNKRSVWTIPTEPFPEAHFAVFPTALVEPCVLAGCPQGGLVLDPFFGAGTTGLVCDRLGRDCIGIELNPAYADIARRRISNDAPLFTDVT